MPLSAEIQKKDKLELTDKFQIILKNYQEKRVSIDNQDAAFPLLLAVQAIACRENIALSKQPKDILNPFFTRLFICLKKVDMEELLAVDGQLQVVAERAMEQVRQALARHARRNVLSSISVGQFDSLPLHQSFPKIQLQDHHIANLMPHGSDRFRVLPAYRFGDANHLTLTIQTLMDVLEDERAQVVILPIGPGHWRSLTFYQMARKTSSF